LGISDLSLGRNFQLDGGTAGDGMFQFLAQDGGVDADLLSNLSGEFVAHDAAGNALDVGEYVVHGLDLAFGGADRELGAGALDQVIEVTLGGAKGRRVGLLAFATNEEVGIETGFEGEYLDVEFFFHEQAESALGGLGTGGVRVEVND